MNSMSSCQARLIFIPASLLISIYNKLIALTPGKIHLLKQVFNRDTIRKKLQDYSNQLTEFNSKFVVCSCVVATHVIIPLQFTRLISIDVNVTQIGSDVAHIRTTLDKASITPAIIPTTLSSLPPPSTIFTGREDVLSKMKSYFSPSTASGQSQQHIFVLYGMGGAGKTQIALKFVQKNATQ